MKRLLLIIPLLVMTFGCANMKGWTAHPRPWTTNEKLLLVASSVAAAADAFTTDQGIKAGCSETFFMVGSYPSTGIIIGYTSIVQLIAIVAAHFNPDFRISILGGKAIANTGCAVRNSTMY